MSAPWGRLQLAPSEAVQVAASDVLGLLVGLNAFSTARGESPGPRVRNGTRPRSNLRGRCDPSLRLQQKGYLPGTTSRLHVIGRVDLIESLVQFGTEPFPPADSSLLTATRSFAARI
eukprot:2583624-Pyramimonas_sp.AAC.1